MLGNEAIARGLVDNGCSVATSYPGTPASEILSSTVRWSRECGVPMHIQWAVNEKVALEISYTASLTGLRSAVGMKQVGLNVASDPLMSAAYTGVEGGFLVISADDPGPHSSQTEQDSRLMAMMAKIPVLDPASPAHAKELVGTGYELSEKFRIPVMLRPTTRVCHACQDIPGGKAMPLRRTADFLKSPDRWAATPVLSLQASPRAFGKAGRHRHVGADRSGAAESRGDGSDRRSGFRRRVGACGGDPSRKRPLGSSPVLPGGAAISAPHGLHHPPP
jgi:indolepyruvate ferredoxin oxidoreductase alpha subunit